LCAVHVGSVAAGHLLGEDCQQRLHDILRQNRIAVAVGEGEQVQGDRRDRNIVRQAFEERFLFPRGADPGVEIGEADQLFQIGPAQQSALHEIEVAARIGLRRQPTQKWGQERIGIEIDSRR
jgi:hypothetical protein